MLSISPPVKRDCELPGTTARDDEAVERWWSEVKEEEEEEEDDWRSLERCRRFSDLSILSAMSDLLRHSPR